MPALSEAFRSQARHLYETHPVVKDNPHTVPFAAAPQGPNHAQVVDLIEQFAHFSLIFLVSQCKAMIHAPTEEIERGARSILVNENGVGINVETGNCERKVFSHLAAHINWLREIALLLKMPIWPDGRHAKFGTAERATRYTQEFSFLLDRVFGSPNPNIACAASFVIESWAGYGIGTEYEYKNFWHQLIVGLKRHNECRRVPQELPPLPLHFFTYHFALEKGHVASVMHQLEAMADFPGFNEEEWLTGGKQALDAMLIFWEGLAKQWPKLADAE